MRVSVRITSAFNAGISSLRKEFVHDDVNVLREEGDDFVLELSNGSRLLYSSTHYEVKPLDEAVMPHHYEVTMRGSIAGVHDTFEDALEHYEKFIVNELPERARFYDIQPSEGTLNDEQVQRMESIK